MEYTDVSGKVIRYPSMPALLRTYKDYTIFAQNVNNIYTV